MVMSLLEYDDVDGSLIQSSIIPIIDGGTEGFKGNARVILPGLTACIECTLDLFPPQVSCSIVKILNLYIILLCTHSYHFFPISIHYLQCIHCLYVTEYYPDLDTLIRPIKGIALLRISVGMSRFVPCSRMLKASFWGFPRT